MKERRKDQVKLKAIEGKNNQDNSNLVAQIKN